MQEEWYEPSPRDIRRANAALATPEGKKRAARHLYDGHRVLDWRIKNEGFCLTGEARIRHDKIMAGRGEYLPPDMLSELPESK